MANGWTAVRRARQAKLIHAWKPWERSTGPRTIEGKPRVARNAYKRETRRMLLDLRRLLRRQDRALRKRRLDDNT